MYPKGFRFPGARAAFRQHEELEACTRMRSLNLPRAAAPRIRAASMPNPGTEYMGHDAVLTLLRAGRTSFVAHEALSEAEIRSCLRRKSLPLWL